MTKRSIRDFGELRTLLKKTESEAEAKAVLKGGEFKTRKLPNKPAPPLRHPRNMSATDQFIEATLAIPLEHLPKEQLYDARNTIHDALEYASASKVSIKLQIDTGEDHIDDQGRSWKKKAESALRFKTQEFQELEKRMVLINELIDRAYPKPKPVSAPYEIRTDVPRPAPRQTDEWKKYPFDKLLTDKHSFRFGPEVKAEEVNRLVSAARRHLKKRFSYRTMPDGITVWLDTSPPVAKKK